MAIGDLQKLRTTIEAAFERRAEITPSTVPIDVPNPVPDDAGVKVNGAL